MAIFHVNMEIHLGCLETSRGDSRNWAYQEVEQMSIFIARSDDLGLVSNSRPLLMEAIAEMIGKRSNPYKKQPLRAGIGYCHKFVIQFNPTSSLLLSAEKALDKEVETPERREAFDQLKGNWVRDKISTIPGYSIFFVTIETLMQGHEALLERRREEKNVSSFL